MRARCRGGGLDKGAVNRQHELVRHGRDKATGEARHGISGMAGMAWVQGCVWLWANSAGMDKARPSQGATHESCNSVMWADEDSGPQDLTGGTRRRLGSCENACRGGWMRVEGADARSSGFASCMGRASFSGGCPS